MQRQKNKNMLQKPLNVTVSMANTNITQEYAEESNADLVDERSGKMSLFPDCRHDDCYNEDFLNNEDKAFIKGMDYAVEQIKTLLTGNLDTYEDELTETLPEGETAGDDEVYASRDDLYEILEENSELLATIVQNWSETERNEMITAMLDDYDDDEYQQLREAGKQPDKEYYDTRKYMTTGVKQPSAD
jgi:hypothetical protein